MSVDSTPYMGRLLTALKAPVVDAFHHQARQRGIQRRIACEHFYESWRPFGSPAWEDLTLHQQTIVRSALIIGEGSINPHEFLREPL